MQELVTVEQAERVIRAAAIALPAAGLVIGAAAGALRRQVARGVVFGLLCGASGPAILGLWRVYNAIVNRYGLDSVTGLLINLGLFAVIGLLLGLAVAAVWRRLAAVPRGSA